jgi:hypothetical protein
MAKQTLSWREEIERGVVPKAVPRDERNEANALIAARLLACDGCAWLTNSLEINGKQAQVASMTTSPSSPTATRRQIHPVQLFSQQFQIDKDDASDSIKLVLDSIAGTIVDGTCVIDEGECVQENPCSFIAELRFIAISRNADPPAITINGGANIGHSASRLGTDEAAPYLRKYTVYVTVDGTCGDSVTQDIGIAEITAAIAGWTVNAAQQADNAPVVVKFTCDICDGGESETD